MNQRVAEMADHEQGDAVTLLAPDTDAVISFAFEKITPFRAKKILMLNHAKQRGLNKGVVSNYAREMRDNRWQAANGESIKIADNGDLIDGQHRLNAVIKADKPVWMLVIRNIGADAFATVDDGKKRNFTDLLTINGNPLPNKHNVAAAVNFLALTKTLIDQNQTRAEGEPKRKIKDFRRNNKLSNKEKFDFLSANEWIIRDIHQANELFSFSTMRHTFGHSAALVCWCIFSRIDRELTYAILHTMQTGLPFNRHTNDTDPAFKLYRAISSSKQNGVRFRLESYLDFFVWCFYTYKRDKEVKFVKLGTTQDFWMREHGDIEAIRNLFK